MGYSPLGSQRVRQTEQLSMHARLSPEAWGSLHTTAEQGTQIWRTPQAMAKASGRGRGFGTHHTRGAETKAEPEATGDKGG